MRLPNHPRLMNDDELYQWVESLITTQLPESNSLDYKSEIKVDGKRNRIEIGKDISSFANEQGGVLLYGVPETLRDGVPIPKSLSECGIEVTAELPETVENILIATVSPPLPELFIKVLNLDELSPKSLLMIHHPESWSKPHMIEGYKDARYYRRGNFRAIVMNEREVEAAYYSRKTSLEHADNFFRTADFRDLPEEGQFFRVILCPRFTWNRKEEMVAEKFKEWLYAVSPENREGRWAPFLDGWAFLSYATGNFHGKLFEYRLFHNGGLSFTLDLTYLLHESGELHLNAIEQHILSKYIFEYSIKFFKLLRISGPLSMQVSLYRIRGLNAKFAPEIWFHDPGTGAAPLEKDSMSFVEEMSVDELMFGRDNVIKRSINRLASAFGLWRR